MRIHVISDLPHFVTGGAERQAANLIEAWLDAGHDVTCLGRRMRGEQVQLGRHVLPVRRIRTLRKLGRWLRGISYLASLSLLLLKRRRRIDVIYTRFLGDAAITVSLLKHLGLLSIPLVAVPASTGGDGSDSSFLANLPFRRWLVRLLDTQCDAINLIAPAMAEELRAAGFSGAKFTAIPNGVRIRDTRPNSLPHPGRFIAVGRVSRQKGLDVLIDAMGLIPEQLKPGLVRVVGDGPELPALQAQAERLGIAHTLQWLGELDHVSVLTAIGQSQVFLLPSRYEGMSNAGLEAMERGLAMLMSRCGGLDAHIRADMGWVVNPEDPRSLATALSEAITTPPPVLSSMGEQNRMYTLQHFDLKMVAARYLDLFTSLHRQESVKSTHDQHHRSRLP